MARLIISARTVLWLCLFMVTAACAPRGFIGYADPELPGASVVKRVYSISNRAYDADYAGAGTHSDGRPLEKTLYSQNLSGKRSETVSFTRLDISVPPNHETGQIEWPRWRKPDVQQHFAVRNELRFDGQTDFLSAMRQEPNQGEVVVFVHGYNVNLAESVYRMAQLSNDYDMDLPVVSFSWPSAARAPGYIYGPRQRHFFPGRFRKCAYGADKGRAPCRAGWPFHGITTDYGNTAPDVDRGQSGGDPQIGPRGFDEPRH